MRRWNSNQWECSHCSRRWDWVAGVAPARDHHGRVLCTPCDQRPAEQRIERVVNEPVETTAADDPAVVEAMAAWRNRVRASRRVS